MPNPETVKGWFATEDRPGDRTLEMQMLGLDPLLEEVKGAVVLDVGAAEGLIAIELAKLGAKVHGIEIIQGHVDVARKLAGPWPSATFEQADAYFYEPNREYDIVLLLAVLHKLPNPSAACGKFARVARNLVVMRLPPQHAPAIVDERSGNVKHDMQAVMSWYGFELERVTRGSFSEWCGFFRRKV